jgi:hypothetical protein
LILYTCYYNRLIEWEKMSENNWKEVYYPNLEIKISDEERQNTGFTKLCEDFRLNFRQSYGNYNFKCIEKDICSLCDFSIKPLSRSEGGLCNKDETKQIRPTNYTKDNGWYTLGFRPDRGLRGLSVDGSIFSPEAVDEIGNSIVHIIKQKYGLLNVKYEYCIFDGNTGDKLYPENK